MTVTRSAMRGHEGRRRWKRLRHPMVVLGVVLGFFLAGGLVVWVASDVLDRSDASVELSVRDGLVVTVGHGFPPTAAAVLSARLPGGSASVWVATTAAGGFDVAFRPPAGFDGDVRVTAKAAGVAAEATVTAVIPSPAGTDPGSGGLMVVPTTGAPTMTSEAFTTSTLPARKVPADITSDCSADVTAALNDWLDSVPDSSLLVFGRGACYQVDGTLALSDRSDLVVEGNGATFRAEKAAPSGANRAQWYLEYGADITLRNMTLVGVNTRAVFDPDHEWDHNLFIRGTHTVTVENVHGRGASGDFIAVAQGPDGVTIPSDITIRNVSADTVGRMGVSCVACDGMSVEDSVFNNIAFHVFDLEIQGDGWPGRRVTFTGNTVGSHGWAMFSVGTPFQTDDNQLSGIHIAGNVMTMPGSSTADCLPAVSFRSSKIHAEDVAIEDNTLLSHTDAIAVRLASDVVISGNSAKLVQPHCGNPVGIRVTDVSGPDVRDNEMQGYAKAQAVQ